MVRALREICAADVGLELRAGVNRGRVFTGDIGSASRRTYAVMGDAVNLAARLTARAGPGAILTTTDVLDRTRTTYATEVEPLLVKGKEAAVMAHTVGEPTGTARGTYVDASDDRRTRSGARRASRGDRAGAAPRAAARRDRRRPRRRQVAARPEARTLAIGFQQLEVVGEPYAKGEPFAAVRGLLRQLVGITMDTPREQAGQQLSLFVSSVAPDLAAWLPLFALPFDARARPDAGGRRLDPARARDRRHETLATLLERLLMMPT